MVAILGAVALASASVRALRSADTNLESQVKAAMVLNFAHFVEWPEEPQEGAGVGVTTPFVIGILGDDPIAGALEAIVRDKTVGHRPVHWKKFRDIPPGEPIQVLYIAQGERRRLLEILAALRNTHILTVSDIEGFTKAGGVIGLVIPNDKVLFDINLDAAREAHLTISSKLLRLARRTGGKDK